MKLIGNNNTDGILDPCSCFAYVCLMLSDPRCSISQTLVAYKCNLPKFIYLGRRLILIIDILLEPLLVDADQYLEEGKSNLPLLSPQKTDTTLLFFHPVLHNSPNDNVHP